MSTLKYQIAYLFKPAFLVFALDQVTKLYIVHTPIMHNLVIMPHLNFHLAFNRGAAFGILDSAGGWQRWVFISFGIAISAIIYFWSRGLHKKDRFEAIALAFVLGGAWGNLLDRVRLGVVIDFIDFYFGKWHWYTFNVADIGICVGAALLAAMAIFQKS